MNHITWTTVQPNAHKQVVLTRVERPQIILSILYTKIRLMQPFIIPWVCAKGWPVEIYYRLKAFCKHNLPLHKMYEILLFPSFSIQQNGMAPLFGNDEIGLYSRTGLYGRKDLTQHSSLYDAHAYPYLSNIILACPK